MPLLLEPGQRYAVCLDTDKDKPQDTRPVFWVLAVSARRSREILDDVKEFPTTDQTIDLLKTLIVGWSNMGREFNVDEIEDVLTSPECFQLFHKILANDYLDTEEKKSSE